MIIISNRYYGQIARCNNCGALLGYTPEDVNSNQNIRCPQCGFMLWVPFNPNYDGVIKDGNDRNTSNTERQNS